MAMKIIVSDLKKPKDIFSRLPRFSIDIRFNNKKVVFQYVPVSETLYRVIKEKKGIIETSLKQFSEFNQKSRSKPKTTVFNP